MKKKFYINSNVERLISFAASLFLILMLNVVLAHTLLKKIHATAEAMFINNCASIASDYALSVVERLKYLESEMDLLYAEIAYKTISAEEIQRILMRSNSFLSVNFVDIFYTDKDGTAYSMNGERRQVGDRDYFKIVMEGESEFYVSDILESKLDGTPIITFSRPILNERNEISGILCGVSDVVAMSDFFGEIRIPESGSISIRDSNLRFIHHYSKDWVNREFDPPKYVRKDFLSTEQVDETWETLNVAGEPIYLFYKLIPNTTWQVGYSVPVEVFKRIEKTQRDYQYFIFEIIAVVLALIFLLEIWIHSVLERHQVLSTHIDSLTHLWVRPYFEKEANKLLRRNPNSKYILIESDIRGFKFINQNHGEAKANQVLYQFSKLLYGVSKSLDGILSRGYADHFYIFIKINSVHRTMHFFRENLASITEEIKKLEIPFTPKFGIAFYVPHKMDSSITAQTLISRANFAKNAIKDNALQNFAIYDEKLLKHSNEENFIETNMESALENNEFFLMYQPKVDLNSDKVVGAEALVRWQSPVLGFMPPNSFIPLFERNNFVIKLDFYVYEQVFKFLRKCLDNNEPVVPISVNMSRNHNKPERFVHDFTALLRKYDVPPSLVEVELLERSSMDKNLLREITIMLQNEGFKVAMDDFGSGESSLNMLSMIPVNVLKFDRSFLFTNNKPVELNESTENFIETLVDLGKNLKKETIFEGVETEEQRDFLRKIKCDQVQGYFYSKPLRESEYMEFLRSHR